MTLLFDETASLLTDMIRAASLRHQILSRNIANVETPGYRPLEVRFEEELRLASEAGEPSATVVRAVVTDDRIGGAGRYDGNTIDLDRQMAKMAENALWHNAMIQILNSRITTLRTAIRGN
ncbi:MAG: flagellar biosynthesis protein FlgB [Candidatus Methylomirabilota bacterium]|nr:MAG: flagellar biosynthesis protein FlgB [candidate division NC10 bacterium]